MSDNTVCGLLIAFLCRSSLAMTYTLTQDSNSSQEANEQAPRGTHMDSLAATFLTSGVRTEDGRGLHKHLYQVRHTNHTGFASSSK